AAGVAERLFAGVRRSPGVVAAAAVVEVTALVGRRLPGDLGPGVELGARRGFDETLLVLGLDPFSEAPFGRLATERAGGVPPGLDVRAGLALLSRPNAVAVKRAVAERRGLPVGD